ncbi:MAG: DUF6580 family putative transport protein [Chitinophagaceae bacterium]
MGPKKIIILVVIIVFSIVYKVIPFHLFQWGITIGLCTFLGATQKIKNAVFLSLMALLVRDCILQLLFVAGYTPIEGFYKGQLLNYILLVGTTLLGHIAYQKKWLLFLGTIVCSSLGFYVFSNLGVWLSGSMYPMNIQGLLQCYTMALPFLKSGMMGDLVFGSIFFYIYSKYALLCVSVKKVK